MVTPTGKETPRTAARGRRSRRPVPRS